MSIRLAFARLLACSVANTEAAFYTGSPLTENFDGIQTTTFSATAGVQTSVAGTIFDAAKVSGTGTSAMPFVTDDGSNNTGGIHNYGATGATDRALGTLASGTNVPVFGVMITNNSGAVLSSITLNFTTEEYRNSTSVQNMINFAYGLSGSTATASNYLTDSSLIADARFNLIGDAPVTTNGALATPIVTPVAGTINLRVGIGQSVFLRWTDTNDAGNDAGLAIDNFRFTATPAGSSVAVPEPASVVMLCLGLVGAGLSACRRSH